MSHLLVCELNMTDASTVARALRKLGFTEVEISEVGELIAKNYNGSENNACSIVVRGDTFGGLADLALKRQTSGNLALYADDMDIVGGLMRVAHASNNSSRVYGFADNLALWYGTLKAEDSVTEMGMMPVTEWVSDKREEMRVYAEYA